MGSALIDSLDDLALVGVTLVPHREPISADTVTEVVVATADAGFGGVSAWSMHHHWFVDDGRRSEEYFDLHRERGLRIVSASLFTEWARGEIRATTEAITKLAHFAERAGSPRLVATCIEAGAAPDRAAVAQLRLACDLAAARGLQVSYEFIPGTRVPDLRAALRLLEDVDRDNLGIVLDAWQWFRSPGGPDWDALAATPSDRIHLLQIDDAPFQPAHDLHGESAGARLLPGEGSIQLVALLDRLNDAAARPVISVEVLNPRRLVDQGARAWARDQYDAAAAVVHAHWASVATRQD